MQADPSRVAPQLHREQVVQAPAPVGSGDPMSTSGDSSSEESDVAGPASSAPSTVEAQVPSGPSPTLLSEAAGYRAFWLSRKPEVVWQAEAKPRMLSDLTDYGSAPVESRPWGLALSPGMVAQLETAFKEPLWQSSLAQPNSMFRVQSEAYATFNKAPVPDPFLKTKDVFGPPRAPQPAQVDNWVRGVGRLFEAAMSQFRVASHQGHLLERAQEEVLRLPASPELDGLRKVLKYLAFATNEQWKVGADAASHAIALARQMCLAQTGLHSQVKDDLARLPFQGEHLFGPSLQEIVTDVAGTVFSHRQTGSLLGSTGQRVSSGRRSTSSGAAPKRRQGKPSHGAPPAKKAASASLPPLGGGPPQRVRRRRGRQQQPGPPSKGQQPKGRGKR